MRRGPILCVYFIISTFIHNTAIGQAKKESYLNIFGGYGLETNYGHTVFWGGAGYEKDITRKLHFGVSLTRFMIGNYDGNREAEKSFDGEERYYKAWFVTPYLGYRLIGDNQTFFSFTLKTGLSAKYFNYKSLEKARVNIYPDGREVLIPGTDKYYQDKDVNISWYAGGFFDFRLSQKIVASLFLDTYANVYWLEHFLPGIRMSYTLPHSLRKSRAN